MQFDQLRTEIEPKSSSFIIGEDICACVDGSWYLNEEQIYFDSFDDAVSVIKEKIEHNKEKYKSLIDESYSVEQAIKIVRKYNNKVSQTILENCIETASSKRLTNDPAVLELRLEDTNLVADKYMFILENNDVVALSNTELLMLEKFDDELLQYGKQSAENLKQILRGIY
jgi:hypothetical protein